MIKCNLSTYMGMNKMNIQDVCDKTGLARNTVAFLYHDKVKAVNFSTLDALCKLFKCSAGDLLEHVDVEETVTEIIQHVNKFKTSPEYRHECRKNQAREIAMMEASE